MDETTDNAEDPVARYRAAFPALELPPNPFEVRPNATAPAAPAPAPVVESAAPATDLAGRPVGGVDQPAGTWHNPLPGPSAAPAPVTGYTWQVAPPPPTPLAAGHVASPPASPAPAASRPSPQTAAPSASPQPALESTSAVPASAPASLRTPPPMVVEPSVPAADDANVAPPKAVVVTLLVLTVVLVWASRMAFSAAVLGVAALVVSELAIALSLARRSGQPRPSAATALAGMAALGAAVTAFLALRELTDEYAFVAGLFVLISVVPTALVAGVALLLLRRASGGAPVAALRTGLLRLLPVLAAALVAGVQAHRTFSAKPDAIVAGVIVVLVAMNVAAVLRGSGRAAA